MVDLLRKFATDICHVRARAGFVEAVCIFGGSFGLVLEVLLTVFIYSIAIHSRANGLPPFLGRTARRVAVVVL